MAGVVDFRLARIPGVPPPPAELLIWKFLPEKLKREILTKAFDILESTGNVEIQRGAFALSEGPKGLEDPRIYVRFSGKFNQEWIVETLKKQTPLDIKEGKGPGGEKFYYTELEREALTMAIMDDTEFLLGGVPDRRGAVKTLALVEEMLQIKAKKKDNVLVGKKTKDLIAKAPQNALGLFVIDLPDELRKNLFGRGGAPITAPSKAVLFMTPEVKALDVQLELIMANDEDAKTSVKGIFKMREEGIRELRMAEGKIPGFSTRPIIQLLESLQVSARGSSVNVRLLLPEDVIRSTVEMMLRLIPAELEPPAPEKEKKGAWLRPVRQRAA
jgi:hypothetical protein